MRKLVFLLVACGGPQVDHPTVTQDASVQRVIADATVATAPDAGAYVPSWIEDDYPKALALAKRFNLPIFVDASAIWCHTCKAMRTYVLDDAALPRTSFVWFTFDVEKESNATATGKYESHVLPSFFIVDPSDESLHGRWEGAGTVAQIRGFLNDGEQSVRLAHAAGLPPNDPGTLLLAGHRATMKSNPVEAERAFAKALDVAPKDWPRVPDALLGLSKAQRRNGHESACVDLGISSAARWGKSSVATDFASVVLGCAEKLPVKDPRITKVRTIIEKAITELAKDTAAPLSADDRGDAWHLVWDAREALGDHAGALEAARARLAVLDAAAKATPDADIASTFDGGRMETLQFLGRTAEAITFLKEHEAALPDDYNPPHRLARVLFDTGKTQEALEAIDRAIKKGYGARKGLMLSLKADILLKLGRKADARTTLQAQLDLYKSLPEGQKKPQFEKIAQERLDKLK